MSFVKSPINHSVAVASGIAILALLSSARIAQTQTVYTVNAVGYVNTAFKAGFTLFEAPLMDDSGTVEKIFNQTPVPDGTVIYSLLDQGEAATPMPDDVRINLESNFLHLFPATLNGVVTFDPKPAGMTLSWVGNLFSALSVEGPYTAVAATSPLTISADGGLRFWRAQIPVTLNSGQFTANVFQSGVWTDPNQILMPGEGFLIYAPSTFTNTFVGSVTQGLLTNTLPAGWSARASMVPQSGGLTTDLALRPQTPIYVFLTQNGLLKQYVYLPAKGWLPSEPKPDVGAAMIVYSL